MTAIIAALWSPAYWRHGFSVARAVTALLSSLGTLWTATAVTSYFWPSAVGWIRAQWILFALIGVALAVWQNRPRVKVSCRLAGRDVGIEIRVADMFSLPGALVIGSNVSFDTDAALISPKSVQGQFTAKFYDSVPHLDGDLSAALAGITSTSAAPSKKGKKAIYPVGTTVHVAPKERRAYFAAIATLNDHGVANGSFDELKTSLPMLWEYVATKGGEFEALVVPVLGSGYSRLTQPREEIIRAIVDSFVAACASSRPTEKMTIVIPFKDFYEHEVDLIELERYVQHVCRYKEFREPSATGVGTAVALGQ